LPECPLASVEKTIYCPHAAIVLSVDPVPCKVDDLCAMPLSLRRNVAWMTSGRVVYALCQWAIIVVLARRGGPAMVGEYAFALALTAPIVIFSQLQMRQVLITDVRGVYVFRDYLAVRLTTTALALVCIAAAVPLGGFVAATAYLILAVGLAKGFESLSDLFYGLEQRHERLDLVGLSLIIRSLSGLTALATALYLTGDLVIAALAMAACWATAWWWYDRSVTRPWRQGISTVSRLGSTVRSRFQLARIGLPLGFTLMLTSLNTNVPRYFLEAELGMEAVGQFAAVVHFYAAGTLVVTAIGQATMARLANYFAAGSIAAFRRLLRTVLILAALLGALGVLAALLVGEQLLTIVYGPAFGRNADIFNWVMIAGGISYLASSLGYGLTAMRVFNVQPLFLIIVVTVTVFGCYLLVARYGVLGAVWAWTAGLLCQNFMYWIAVARHLKDNNKAGSPQKG
jgi:O-antigen/teichoic acid export membrane protein